MSQWFLKITDYSDELLNDLEQLTGWPERVKLMQKNWIGKSEGAELQFTVESKPNIQISVFTTRPDTAFGVTYLSACSGKSSGRAANHTENSTK